MCRAHVREAELKAGRAGGFLVLGDDDDDDDSLQVFVEMSEVGCEHNACILNWGMWIGCFVSWVGHSIPV